jgi:hypothetical protein
MATTNLAPRILGQLFRCGETIANAGERALANTRRTLGFLRGRTEFVARNDDVYVVNYPRSGTTWMQFMLYRLAAGNDLDFSHISQVSPWFERSLAIGSMTAANFERFPSPRIMKSHLPYGWLDRGRSGPAWLQCAPPAQATDDRNDSRRHRANSEGAMCSGCGLRACTRRPGERKSCARGDHRNGARGCRNRAVFAVMRAPPSAPLDNRKPLLLPSPSPRMPGVFSVKPRRPWETTL